jgi:hypothetical protein
MPVCTLGTVEMQCQQPAVPLMEFDRTQLSNEVLHLTAGKGLYSLAPRNVSSSGTQRNCEQSTLPLSRLDSEVSLLLSYYPRVYGAHTHGTTYSPTRCIFLSISSAASSASPLAPKGSHQCHAPDSDSTGSMMCSSSERSNSSPPTSVS